MNYNVIHDYLSQVGAAYASRSQDPFTLASLLVVDAQKHALLSHALRAPQNSDLPKKLHTLLRVQKTDRLVPFIDSLFNYLATQPPTAQLVARGPAQLPIQAYRPAYDAWAAVWTKAFAIFSLPEATWFGASLRHFGLVLLHLAVKADKYQVQTSSTKNPCITDAASKLSKAAGLAAIDRTPAAGQETKRREVLWLANLSFYAYFKLNNLRLCDTVLSSVDSAFALNRQFAPLATSALAGANADQGESCYSRADRVTYRYYLGRLRLMQHRIRVAHTHLRWAFDNCIVSSRNKVFILVPLLVASLILGHYPTPALLQASGLDPQFGPLVERLRLGDGAGMLQELNRWREWHRSRGIYLLLRERLQTACWRNLIRRTLLVSRKLAGQNSGTVSGSASPMPTNGAAAAQAGKVEAPPNIYLREILPAARLAWRDEELTLADVECVVCSLIDQGLIKGYLMHKAGRLVLQRGPSMGFVPVASVR